MYFESHAHYDDSRYDKDRDELLSSLPSFGIDYVVNAGIDLYSSEYGLALADKYDFIYAAVGYHPHEVKELTEEKFTELKELASHPKVVAVGEIGLDFYYDNSPRQEQRYWFKRQLDWAAEADLPVIIHSREAAQECFNMIKASKVRRGVIHCYSGSPEMAQEYIKMGFYIGIGGVITYKNSKNLKNVAKTIPLERILLETDCPYLSPRQVRGQRNDSKNLQFVVEEISKLREIEPEILLSITKNNAKSINSKRKT